MVGPTITKTSSYHELEKLGEKQERVLRIISALAPVSDRRVARALDWPINRVVPRRHELVEMGLVRQYGVEHDQGTNRQVIIWGPVSLSLEPTPAPKLTHEEIRAFARRLIAADKQAVEMNLSGYWKDMAKEILASITTQELDWCGSVLEGYNRTGGLEKYPEYNQILELKEKRRQEIAGQG